MIQRNVIDWLEASASKHPEKNAFETEHESISYSALLQRAKEVGTFLASVIPAWTPVLVIMDKVCYKTCGDAQEFTGWDVYLNDSSSPTPPPLTTYPISITAGVTYGTANPITLRAHCESVCYMVDFAVLTFSKIAYPIILLSFLNTKKSS